MAIRYIILLSRQGKVRLAKWYSTSAPREKAKIVKDVSQLVLARRTRMCNFLEYKGQAPSLSTHLHSHSQSGRQQDSVPPLCLSILHRCY